MELAYAHIKGPVDDLDTNHPSFNQIFTKIMDFRDAVNALIGAPVFSPWDPTRFSFQKITVRYDSVYWAKECLSGVKRLIEQKENP